jgi:hypothetical protein
LVSRKDLFPESFGIIWPELNEKPWQQQSQPLK